MLYNLSGRLGRRDEDFTQSYRLALQFWVQPNRIFTVGVPQASHGINRIKFCFYFKVGEAISTSLFRLEVETFDSWSQVRLFLPFWWDEDWCQWERACDLQELIYSKYQAKWKAHKVSDGLINASAWPGSLSNDLVYCSLSVLRFVFVLDLSHLVVIK